MWAYTAASYEYGDSIIDVKFETINILGTELITS
jgi:hypothetical protein